MTTALDEVAWFLRNGQPMIPDIAVIRGVPQSEPFFSNGDEFPTPLAVVMAQAQHAEARASAAEAELERSRAALRAHGLDLTAS